MMTAEARTAGQVEILIVEDSLTQAQRLKYMLEGRGYQVASASNGRRALEMARAVKPTLIISDIVMPKMDGYELCSRIKSDVTLKDVPVILVTTLSDPHDVIRGLECRADNFVMKPYDENYLVSRIQFILLNYEIRKCDHAGAGIEILFNGQRHVITADRLQILNLLLSTYEAAIERNRELTRTKDALRAANESLEAANKELESFSYSVSHDLRAPLRAIEGFNQALLEDFSEQLGEDGQALLQSTQNAASRMKQLIEDLLNLSRISRGELQRESVDLGALAESVIAELHIQFPQRTLKFTASPGLIASADRRLLRIAFENLLGNAWKFTSRRPDPAIEIGAIGDGPQRSFFIRDNGAGFDMAYATKLFGAFQRLHSSSEFPGTGIGLATVQRIIHRHGGRIWAQGTVGEGATFQFTL